MRGPRFPRPPRRFGRIRASARRPRRAPVSPRCYHRDPASAGPPPPPGRTVRAVDLQWQCAAPKRPAARWQGRAAMRRAPIPRCGPRHTQIANRAHRCPPQSACADTPRPPTGKYRRVPGCGSAHRNCRTSRTPSALPQRGAPPGIPAKPPPARSASPPPRRSSTCAAPPAARRRPKAGRIVDSHIG